MRRPYIFKTMNSVRSNHLSLKYQRFTLKGCQDIGIRKFELWQIKTQSLCKKCVFFKGTLDVLSSGMFDSQW